jgi:hypothetical protein
MNGSPNLVCFVGRRLQQIKGETCTRFHFNNQKGYHIFDNYTVSNWHYERTKNSLFIVLLNVEWEISNYTKTSLNL